ncbi:hypothetical protein IE077_000638 [Cardiosporidium cionae]|uniref:Uncharacterized protein n=1 Tax=Cardiosporidium cionae TaxID=476202 RepID=A0ABQ7JEB5_9APIC|nr:hypothetical protein IE077_000638 [Cardiosporidium cionae]|eukprot:KAF8822339.1 hypothetical protein IE077_000638 [Cardiosporidium cionae]
MSNDSLHLRACPEETYASADFASFLSGNDATFAASKMDLVLNLEDRFTNNAEAAIVIPEENELHTLLREENILYEETSLVSNDVASVAPNTLPAPVTSSQDFGLLNQESQCQIFYLDSSSRSTSLSVEANLATPSIRYSSSFIPSYEQALSQEAHITDDDYYDFNVITKLSMPSNCRRDIIKLNSSKKSTPPSHYPDNNETQVFILEDDSSDTANSVSTENALLETIYPSGRHEEFIFSTEDQYLEDSSYFSELKDKENIRSGLSSHNIDFNEKTLGKTCCKLDIYDRKFFCFIPRNLQMESCPNDNSIPCLLYLSKNSAVLFICLHSFNEDMSRMAIKASALHRCLGISALLVEYPDYDIRYVENENFCWKKVVSDIRIVIEFAVNNLGFQPSNIIFMACEHAAMLAIEMLRLFNGNDNKEHHFGGLLLMNPSCIGSKRMEETEKGGLKQVITGKVFDEEKESLMFHHAIKGEELKSPMRYATSKSKDLSNEIKNNILGTVEMVVAEKDSRIDSRSSINDPQNQTDILKAVMKQTEGQNIVDEFSPEVDVVASTPSPNMETSNKEKHSNFQSFPEFFSIEQEIVRYDAFNSETVQCIDLFFRLSELICHNIITIPDALREVPKKYLIKSNTQEIKHSQSSDSKSTIRLKNWLFDPRILLPTFFSNNFVPDKTSLNRCYYALTAKVGFLLNWRRADVTTEKEDSSKIRVDTEPIETVAIAENNSENLLESVLQNSLNLNPVTDKSRDGLAEESTGNITGIEMLSRLSCPHVQTIADASQSSAESDSMLNINNIFPILEARKSAHE